MNKLLKWSLLTFCALAANVVAAPKIQYWEHSNGAKIYFVQTKEIPMVDIQIDWRAGSMYDPDLKLGLASMTASMLDKGAYVRGKLLTEEAISDQLALQGASLSINAGSERGSLKIRSLSDSSRLSQVVELTAAVLQAPAFDQKILQREKERVISAIREADLKPDVILSREFDRRIYGQHPFSRYSTPKTIATIDVESMRQFYKSHYYRSGAIVTVVGDLNPSDINNYIEKLLAGLPKDIGDKKPIVPVALLSTKPLSDRETKISHPALQAHISMGMPAISRQDPDYFPLLVGNYSLGGGGFVSRLVKEVREKRGLAYSVYSYFAPGTQRGPFVASMQTQKSQANDAVDILRKTIAQYIEEGPSDEEVEFAKTSLRNGFPLRIDSNRKILDNVSSIAWLGLPLDTLDTWTDQVDRVTKEQVKAAFQRHLDMSKMVTVVIGAP